MLGRFFIVFSRIYSLVLMILAGFISMAMPAYALDVSNARYGVHPDKTRFVLETSEIADFRVFTMESPYRIVLDMPAFSWRGAPLMANGKAGVKAVRMGSVSDGVSRIILEFGNPVSVLNAFSIPPQDGKPSRLVVDFAPASAGDFKAAQSRVFGTMTAGEGVERQMAAMENSQAAAPVVHDAPMKLQAVSQNEDPQDLRAQPNAPKPLIVLDPGHGGQDPGARGANGVDEKNVVLNLARELKNQLEASGRYRVMMTRESDVFIKLANRVKFARDHGADLFVSIHADSLDKPHVQGASVYTLSDKASDEQTEKLAARENRSDLIAGLDLSTEDEDVVSILMDLAMRDTMNQSRYFAGAIVDNFGNHDMKLLERPHRYAGFAVLKAPDVPSVLIEAGFMSNSAEAAMLSNPEHRARVARAIRAGIDTYFQAVNEGKRT